MLNWHLYFRRFPGPAKGLPPAPGPVRRGLQSSPVRAPLGAALRLGAEKQRPRRTNTRSGARGFPSEKRDGLILTRERGGFFDSLSVLFRGYDLPQATSPSGLRKSGYRRPDGRCSGKAAPGGAGGTAPALGGLRGGGGAHPRGTAGFFLLNPSDRNIAPFFFLTYFYYCVLRC